ncbi:MAG: selenocysteine-specific translation elongation factor [Candidatus Obscuribacterales bacterium]|nr:selenocysteine-specific translation elongation factor [Candidatus Obscuribacterales bacterium]
MPTAHFTLATAGHVDHGKTSLLRALTGVDTDRLKEERERQMTTDLGFAPLIFNAEAGRPEIIAGFIDVPGHGKFLKNMLAGVGGVQIALLVVAADEGPMPQTVQHIKILSLLGVKGVILALSKVDLVGAGSGKKTIEESEDDCRRLLQDYGLEVLLSARVNAHSKASVEALKLEIGRVLLGLLSVESMSHEQAEAVGTNAAVSTKKVGGAFLAVDRVFVKAGYGRVVTGTLLEGELKSGDSVYLTGVGLSAAARVRGLENFGRKLDKALPGQRLAVNLTFKEEVLLSRGVIITGSEPQTFGGILAVLQDAEGGKLEQSKLPMQVKIYHGTAEYPAYLRWLDKRQEGGYFAQLAFQAEDERYRAPVRLQDRFIMRWGESGSDIAGGTVLTGDRPAFLKRHAVAPLLSALAELSFHRALDLVLSEYPRLALKESELSWFLPGSLETRALAKENEIEHLAGHYLSFARYEKLKETVKEALLKQLSAGQGFVVIESLRTAVCPFLEREVFGEVITNILASENLTRQAGLQRQGDRIVATAESGVNAKAEALLVLVKEKAILEIKELASLAGLSLKDAKQYLEALEKREEAFIVAYDFAASAAEIARAHKILGKLWQSKRDISPSDFRESMQISRKYIMALLSFFDDRQVTRRVGNGRMLLKAPKAD